jgi:hypothetical protein
LLQSSSITEASELCGVSSRSFTRYLQNDEFRERLRQAKLALIGGAVNELRMTSKQMVGVLKSVALDPIAPFQARVSAARSIISLAIECGDIQELRQELRQLEARTINAAAQRRRITGSQP